MTLAVAGRGALRRNPSQSSHCYLTLYYRQHAASAVYPFSQPCRRSHFSNKPLPALFLALSSAPGSAAPAPRKPPRRLRSPPRSPAPRRLRPRSCAVFWRRGRGRCEARPGRAPASSPGSPFPSALRPPGSTLNNSGFWSPTRPVVQVFVLPAAAVTLHYSQSAK